MLQNFSDEEIEDLLDTGSLYHETSGLWDRWISSEAVYDLKGRVVGTAYQHRRKPEGSCGIDPSMPQQKLSDLLLCEYITFDDIRAKWKYHGVLMGSPKFQEK